MGKFFGPQTSCLYLDQFASGHVCDRSPEGVWSEIAKLVRLGCENRRLICSLSIEHMYETSQRTEGRAEEHDMKFRELAQGWAFFPFRAATSRLLSDIAEETPERRDSFLGEASVPPLAQERTLDLFRNEGCSLSDKYNSVLTPLEPVRAQQRQGQLGNPEHIDLTIQRLKLEIGQRLTNRLPLHLAGEWSAQGAGSDTSLAYDWTQGIMHDLVHEHHLNKEELELLSRRLVLLATSCETGHRRIFPIRWAWN